MAGMLPGVEAARRRRIHQTSFNSSSSINSSCSSSRRLSFSLFSTNSNINTSTSASSFSGISARGRSRTSYEDRDVVDEEDDDAKLGAFAREAKSRLDAKLRSPPLISTSRNYNRDERIARLINNNNNNNKENQVTRKKKKKNGKVNKFSWSWKTGDQNNDNKEECAVCLDEMKEDDDIMNLECHHTFHSNCLLPWLHTNAHCPCCRLRIIHPL